MMHTISTNKSGTTVVMIVQSLPPLPSGGAEIQALRLSKKLKEKGINVIFITPGVGKIKGPYIINGIPIFRLHSFLNYLLDLLFFIQKKSSPKKTTIEFDDSISENNKIIAKIGFGSRLRYNIFLINAFLFLSKRKKEIDIIHSHTIEWPAYAAAVLSKWLNKQLLVKDSTMNGIFNIMRFPAGKKKQQLIIDRASFIAMTGIIKKNLLKAGVPETKIFYIPNGIETSDIHKKNYGDGKKVLFVGNLYQQPAKGVDILLKAWAQVIIRYPDATLQIAGDGDLKAYIDYCTSIGIADSTTFLGKHNDIVSLMLAADLFVLPSRREGMPNVLMEAMLRGLPCIATDISGSQDLISDGENGLLVPPSDIAALAKSIIYMFENNNDSATMDRRARETITNLYNMDIIADKYVTIYQNLQLKKRNG